MTYLLAALGALVLYLLVVLPWLHRREDSLDLERRLRSGRSGEPSPRAYRPAEPSASAPPSSEGESVESVLTPSEAQALLGDPPEPAPGDDDGLVVEPPPWPTKGSPAELEPVVGLHTGDVSLATMLLLRLQAEGIAYQELGEVWGSRKILIPRRHQNDVRRILEELRRDVRAESDDD